MKIINPYINPSDGSLALTGEYVPPRTEWGSASGTSVTGTVHFTSFTAKKTATVTTLTSYTGGTAAAATPTICRMGLYSVDAAGGVTLMSATANDTTLFASINTAYAKNLAAAQGIVAGQRYATALLVVTGAALPVFLGAAWAGTTPAIAVNFDLPWLTARMASQADLPTGTTAVASLVGGFIRIGMKLT